MALTKISGDVIQSSVSVGVVTATTINVGSAVTINTEGFQVGSSSLHSSGVSLNNINATGVVTATSFVGDGSALTGIAVTANVRTNSLVVSGVSTFSSNPIFIGAATSTGTASQPLQVTGGAYVSGNLGIGTTNPGSKLTVLGPVQIQNDAAASGRLILRAKPGNPYRWNFDNDGTTNALRIFREDDSNAANGVVYAGITSTGDFQFNSGYGSVATAYGCRAWVNFNGTGTVSTNQTIRASGNVSTVFKNATGDYTINFTTAMPDLNYCVTTGCKKDDNTSTANGNYSMAQPNAYGLTTVRLICSSGSGIAQDLIFTNISVFR